MAIPGNDVFLRIVAELNARLVKKEFSAEELARAFADRLEQLGPRLQRAGAVAQRAGAAPGPHGGQGLQKRPSARPAARRPLCREGSAELRRPAHHLGRQALCRAGLRFHAKVIDKLSSVGSVIVGKLSMVELAGGGGYRSAAASLFGPGLNPWTARAGRAVLRAALRCGRSRPGALRHRLGDFRPPSSHRRVLWRHRAAPHLRPGQPARRHGAFLDAR